MHAYIRKNLHSSRKYSSKTLETYYQLGDKLYNARQDGLLMLEALDRRWDLPKIYNMLKSPDALKLYHVTVLVSKKEIFDNIDPKLKRNYLHWNDYFESMQK
jgi:hypothetical protein